MTDECGDSARWTIDSAGTGNYHIGELPDARMRPTRDAAANSPHRCRQVTEDDFDRFDIIIAMDRSNEQNLRRLAQLSRPSAKSLPMSEFFDGIASPMIICRPLL